jgi:hypothetical protein
MENHFKVFTVKYNERNKNIEADDLAKVIARNMPMPVDVFFQVLEDASVKTIEPEPRLINIIEGEDSRAPVIEYLHHYYESDNTNEHIRLQQRTKAHQIIDNELYKTSISRTLLRCLSEAEGQELLSKVHTGVDRGHISARALAAKVICQGFYWPAIIDDATKLVAKCEACQKFSYRSKAPAQPS